MEENTRITAIIKTFNSGATLCSTLESIKGLDEVYIIDEHSTDDTVEIAKEYKAHIIYSNKGELLNSLNQAINESGGGWFFVIKDNEIIPQKLIYEIKKYIETPQKKRRNAISVPLKTFYYKNEVKSLSKNSILRVFKRGSCVFCSNFSTNLKLKEGKIYKLNKNFKLKNGYILSYHENDISRILSSIIEKNKITIKTTKLKNFSIFLKPIYVFIKYYFLKGAIFDGKYGYILSIEKFIEEFSLQLMIMDKNFKGEQNDF